MILNLSGGAPLNFSVTAYASESNMPTSAPENAIAVITTTAISGYVFSSEQPASPVAGMVWFSTGIASPVEFSVTAKNPVSVYPLAAMQYVSSVWQPVTAKIFQNGTWSRWIQRLYYQKDFTDFTGGITQIVKGYNAENPNVSGTATLTMSSDYMHIYKNDPNKTYGVIVYCKNKIDLTGWRTLKVRERITGAYYQRLCIWSSFGTYINDNIVAQVAFGVWDQPVTGTIETKSIDVSNLRGEYIVGFGCITDPIDVYIYDWWLE